MIRSMVVVTSLACVVAYLFSWRYGGAFYVYLCVIGIGVSLARVQDAL